MDTICDYKGGTNCTPIVCCISSESVGLVKHGAITLSPGPNFVIYYMNRNLYGVITRGRSGIHKSMQVWKELLINGVYVAAVLALIYILTYTDMVSHLLAS